VVSIGSADELKVGDLVQKVCEPRSGCLAIIAELSMENYFQFIAWIKIVYVDGHGGFEWVQDAQLRIVGNKKQK
tara:strand:+ start:519 stop:740 length:222 start_codon:yes stop_codon:yes gene_type:complete